ncbi:MAG: aminoglycoside phosphotransferase family protein [bacterium]|nr:aminoglycoside phosphotransferase family protein [bacterium]
MNKILNLFDETYVNDLFNQEVLPLYPDFVKIQNIKITPIKKNIWTTTYHVVIEFMVSFLDRSGQPTELPIYCSAHSGEPRKSSFEALAFLWDQGFSQGHLAIPRPLFFSEYFNGYFYRGVQGQNLYHYIRHKNFDEIRDIIPKAAAWFAKLHSLPAEQAKNFNKQNSRVKTVIPGFDLIFNKLKRDYSGHYSAYKETFEFISKKETEFLAAGGRRWLIHGDAHPENVIKMSANTIAVIDFTDICLADFARDLGAFLQQFEYMSIRKIEDENYVKNIQDLFLNSYLELAGIKLDAGLKQRINYYYGWTSLRTATLFLLKENPEPERAHELLVKVRRDLKLD